eukprot:1105107-Rhodomonas_salina.1
MADAKGDARCYLALLAVERQQRLSAPRHAGSRPRICTSRTRYAGSRHRMVAHYTLGHTASHA